MTCTMSDILYMWIPQTTRVLIFWFYYTLWYYTWSADLIWQWHTWGSGPLLCMACTSPISFNWFLCTITEKIGVSTVVSISMDTLVFLCCFQLQKQENLHKPFEWHSKINTKHTHTPAHLHFPLIIKLLHTPLRLVFSLCNSTND
jgi:hypothetical protein